MERVHAKYEKMAESSSEFGSVKINKKDTWVVTEKVHGANFCIITDSDGSVLYAKRDQVLQHDEDFFDFRQTIPAKYENRVRSLFTMATEKIVGLLRLSIFGELFGGGYVDPASTEAGDRSGLQLIQSGVFYCPWIDFYAFDIRYECQDGQSGLYPNYMDYDIAMELFEAAGLFYAKPLFRGTYQQCLEYPLGFNSTIPARLSLPPLPSNKAEGVVIKPVKTRWIEHSKGRKRMVLKRKISEFSEKKYDDNRFVKGGQLGSCITGTPQQDDHVSSLWYELQARITDARLKNVLSKIGSIDFRNRESCLTLLQLLQADIIEDAERDGVFELTALPSETKDRLLRELSLACKQLISEFARPLLATNVSNG